MQTDTETLALALGEDICPITDEERVTLIRKMINIWLTPCIQQRKA